MANFDPLSRLLDYFTLREWLQHEINRAERYRTPLSLARVDIDQFVKIAIRHGESKADQILSSVAKVLKDFARNTDLCGRLDREQFCMAFTHTNIEGARIFVARLEQRLRELEFFGAKGEALGVGFNFGVVQYGPGVRDLDALFHQLELAVKQARTSGDLISRLMAKGSGNPDAKTR